MLVCSNPQTCVSFVPDLFAFPIADLPLGLPRLPSGPPSDPMLTTRRVSLNRSQHRKSELSYFDDPSLVWMAITFRIAPIFLWVLLQLAPSYLPAPAIPFTHPVVFLCEIAHSSTSVLWLHAGSLIELFPSTIAWPGKLITSQGTAPIVSFLFILPTTRQTFNSPSVSRNVPPFKHALEKQELPG